MIKEKKHWMVRILLSLLLTVQPAFGNPLSMVHVNYSGTHKLTFKELSYGAFLKKGCDDMRKASPIQPVPPFRVTGKFEDIESYSEDVYISPDNSYYASYRKGYTIEKPQKAACQYKIIPLQVIQIVYYKQRSAYKFDSSRPSGEQWSRDELPGAKNSKKMAKTMTGLMGFTVSPTGRKDKIANLYCEVGELSTPQPEFKGTSCIWRANDDDRMNFLGFPLELVLSSKTQIAKGAVGQKMADSVNLKEAYDPSVFEVPSEVKNMPFYADEPNYTQSESDDSDLDCEAEKRKTGFNPCGSTAEAAKWCAAIKASSGKDPCLSDGQVDDSE